ncbi:MAG: WD40/YVTN/BNR-like repeat-containing protein, partial [Syntrophothermus sp.]
MKKFKLHFILLYMSFFVLMLAIPVNNCIQAQWIQTNGPYGGTISSIAADGNKVVADISFLSTDAGKNWKPINKIKSLNSVQALLIRGDTILAGINYGGLYISTNNGSNWDQNIQGLKADADIMSLAIAGNGKIYAGTDSGLFNSTNNGISWSPVHVGLINIPVTSIAVKESLIALA